MASHPAHNYVNPPTRPPGVQATGVIFIILVTLSLSLRLFTRLRVRGSFGIDDLFATTGTLLTISTLLVQIIANTYFHQNRHTWDIPPSDLITLKQFELAYIILFSQSACQIKLSLLCFARKIIGVATTGNFLIHYISLIALVIIVSLCEVLVLILTLVQCRPLKAVWDTNPNYHYTCFQTGLFYAIAGIINTVTDFACTVLPASIVLKVQMPLNKRIGVAAVFLVGIFVNVASALRIYYFYLEAFSNDYWNSYQAAITSNFELGLGVLCINTPVIRPLIRQYTGWLHTSRHTYEGPGYSHPSKVSKLSKLSKLTASREKSYNLGSIDEPFKGNTTGKFTTTATAAPGDQSTQKWGKNANNTIGVMQTVELKSTKRPRTSASDGGASQRKGSETGDDEIPLR